MFQRYSEHMYRASFFISPKKQRKVESQVKQKNPMWTSTSILVGAVLAIIAFVRGDWQIPLLIGAFAIWGMRVFLILGLPTLRIWRNRWGRKRQELETEKARKTAEAERNAAENDPEAAQALLRHVNHRISDQFKSLYPEARWEWKTKNPTLLAIHGGIGRIRVYGVPEYEYADVELEQSGMLSCSLVKRLAPPSSEQEPLPQPPNQQDVDPQVWYERQGRKTLETLIADLDSRGHHCLFLKEDGSICVRPMEGDEETVQDTLKDFPEKRLWERLVKVLEDAGLAAVAREDCITIAW